MGEKRERNLARLDSLNVKINDLNYLVMHYLIDDLKCVIPEFGGRRVFDIGCGNKPYEVLFTNDNLSYRGCDVVQSSLQKVDIICEANNIPEPSASYDTVLCTQVLEHVSDPDCVVNEAYRLLIPAGHFIISVPFAWELHEEPYDFYRYSKHGIESILSRNGFEVVQITANGGKWAAIAQLNLNMIYSTFKGDGFFRKILKFVFYHLKMTAIVNRLAIWADRKWHDELLTLNYVVVAKKVGSI